jgi:predicted ATPase
MKRTFSKLLSKAILEAAPPRSAKPKPTTMTVSSATLENRVEMFNHIFDHMTKSIAGFVLTGGTGIGKTTSIKQLSTLLGVKTVVIEAPHISEEHLINIPFIIFTPGMAQGQAQQDTLKVDDYNIVYGRSHLLTQLQQLRPFSDQQLLAVINKSDKNTQAIWQSLGGSETTVPRRIAQLRQRYSGILFIDEFHRKTSSAVRTMMRSLVVDKKIGDEKIPRSIYGIYASNIEDTPGTIDVRPEFQHLVYFQFPSPNKSDFFHYLIARWEKDNKSPLKPEVVNAFYKALQDHHMSFQDSTTTASGEEKDIRTSPRRWEQVILYVNASVPVKSDQEAASLLTNVKSMFQDNAGTSSIYNEIVKPVVEQIIRDTSGGQFSAGKHLPDTEWRDTLYHQIQTAERMGSQRQYVPIVAGAHGIGKTTMMADIADRLNLGLITVTCNGLRPEDVTGMVLPKKDKDKYEVKFAEPPLYNKIMTQRKEYRNAFLSNPNISKEKKREWLDKPFKYVLFFDEFNRPESPTVFNTLRRVILEKSFTDEVKLPDDILVVAAMNPEGKLTQPLTGHMKDATDFISAAPSWSKFKEFMDKLEDPNISEEAATLARTLLTNFAERYKLGVVESGRKIHSDSVQFHLSVGDTDIYIAPREYTQMLFDLELGLDRIVDRKDRYLQPNGEPDLDKYLDAVLKMAKTKMEMSLRGIFDKYETDPELFLDDMDIWLGEQKEALMTAEQTGASLENIFDNVVRNPKQHLKDSAPFLQWLDTKWTPSDFTNEFLAWLKKTAGDELEAFDTIENKTHYKKVFSDNVVQTTDELIDKITFVTDEILTALKSHNMSGSLGNSMDQAFRQFWKETFIPQISQLKRDALKSSDPAKAAALASLAEELDTRLDTYQKKIAAKLKVYRQAAA